MPGRKHLPGVTAKGQRQYEHIRESLLQRGVSEAEARRIAAATTHKFENLRRKRKRTT